MVVVGAGASVVVVVLLLLLVLLLMLLCWDWFGKYVNPQQIELYGYANIIEQNLGSTKNYR